MVDARSLGVEAAVLLGGVADAFLGGVKFLGEVGLEMGAFSLV